MKCNQCCLPSWWSIIIIIIVCHKSNCQKDRSKANKQYALTINLNHVIVTVCAITMTYIIILTMNAYSSIVHYLNLSSMIGIYAWPMTLDNWLATYMSWGWAHDLCHGIKLLDQYNLCITCTLYIITYLYN